MSRHAPVLVGSLVAYDPPPLPASPVDPARTTLYSADELYDSVLAGSSYDDGLDASAYAWSRRPRTPGESMARALHDHAMDEALDRFVDGRRLVGVMGGHAWQRGSTAYEEAAQLGHTLGATYTVATGGGPGAMEAANLGARLAGRPDDLGAALAILTEVPTYHPSIDAWVHVAQAVRDAHPEPAESLGIRTWHYGHEPPNVFATAIAKYFGNPAGGAILLEVCDAGIVFLEGSGGTVQEIFQDACENYYADESSVAPMVLVGATYWTETLPAWPLLQSLARGRVMEDHVHLADSLEEAAALVSQPAGPDF